MKKIFLSLLFFVHFAHSQISVPYVAPTPVEAKMVRSSPASFPVGASAANGVLAAIHTSTNDIFLTFTNNTGGGVSTVRGRWTNAKTVTASTVLVHTDTVTILNGTTFGQSLALPSCTAATAGATITIVNNSTQSWGVSPNFVNLGGSSLNVVSPASAFTLVCIGTWARIQ